MKPDEMRELFKDALAEPVSVACAGTDDIVAAGRRRVRRRRVAQAGSGSLAAIAAVALFAIAPLVFAQGGAADATTDGAPDDVGPVGPVEVCPPPSDEPTGWQAGVAAAYDTALTEYMASIGGSVADSCVQGEVNHDGFHYDERFGGYRFAEVVVFPDSGERVTLGVDVHDPLDGDVEARLEELSRCEALDLACGREEVPEGSLLLVEEQRRIVIDDDERPEGELVPVNSALLALQDGTIVHVQMAVEYGPGSLSTTPEQLSSLAAAIPVAQDVPYIEESEDTDRRAAPTDDELIYDFVEAASSTLGGSPFTSPDSIEFTDTGEDYHYGQDDTRVAAAEVTLNGTSATLFLQVTPIEAPEDGAADGIAAEHYAQCSYAADCEYSPLDESTELIHRTVEDGGTELTSLELRSADGWVVGVGLVTDDPAAIDFATLDAIVAGIR
ncbi:hypothetical protein L0U85_09280 [Glycomyces sp. L485]|uniref:hypothetical protein n=1 Tax=Glycomyces sp. L485 TaxID=2909235 RepID=UPI001F4AEE6F|nr:hypothetical protein [Glycomyces sp. L485]MCH7231041.1 hypothetical protein [Glycomyces sp. L485]